MKLTPRWVDFPKRKQTKVTVSWNASFGKTGLVSGCLAVTPFTVPQLLLDTAQMQPGSLSGMQGRGDKASPDDEGLSMPRGSHVWGFFSTKYHPMADCSMFEFHNQFSWKLFLKCNTRAVNTLSIFKEPYWAFSFLLPSGAVFGGEVICGVGAGREAGTDGRREPDPGHSLTLSAA